MGSLAFGNIGQQSEKEDAGMSKLFYAACAAMNGILSNPKITEHFELIRSSTDQEIKAIVKVSYKIALQLVYEENKPDINTQP